MRGAFLIDFRKAPIEDYIGLSGISQKSATSGDGVVKKSFLNILWRNETEIYKYIATASAV